MPLLFYFPLIVWMGMAEIMQDQMCAPAKIKTREPAGVTPGSATIR